MRYCSLVAVLQSRHAVFDELDSNFDGFLTLDIIARLRICYASHLARWAGHQPCQDALTGPAETDSCAQLAKLAELSELCRICGILKLFDIRNNPRNLANVSELCKR